MITAEQLRRFAPKCDAEAMAPSLSDAADRFAITGNRLPNWLAQLHHESGGFTRMVENLNYSAKRLMQVWPRRFPTLQAAQPFAVNAAALAEKVYGGRLGNVQPGDGAKFIGRGLTQLTGRANYSAAAQALDLPLLDDPDLAATPAVAALIAGWFWDSRGLNALADRDDIEGITRKINGGTIGLAERKALVAKAKTIWP